MNSLFRRLAFAAAFVLLSAPSFAETEEELILRGVAHFDEMLRKYPADKYHVIGLGPTVVVQSAAARARLGENWKSYFSELPVAYFNEFEVLSPEVQKSLLPTAEQVGGRKVVVFRVLMTGASMRHYLPEFAGVLKREKIASQVEGYFISPPEVSTEGGFYPDWGQPKESLPKVSLVTDAEYAKWLNHRNLEDPTASIHGQTFYQHIPLDEVEEKVTFKENESSGQLDQTVSFLLTPCKKPLSSLGGVAQ